jgi:hypothetical protein
MVIPDTDALLDGHTVITFSYSIYVHRPGLNENIFKSESELHLQKIEDPDYRDAILFKIPGRVYEYIAHMR